MLEELGLGEAPSRDEADVLVFNTCTIREKPDTKLAAYLGDAAAQKRQRPDTVIAVGGCYAEAQRDRLFTLYPQVDVAFGPGTIAHLAEWLGAGGFGVDRSAFGTGDERRFAAQLPMHRERVFQAWVQISMGCNSVCSYCIVPAVRGREVSRRPGEILAEVGRLAGAGVREFTLLGQNVNSYGRDLGTDFAQLLRAVDATDGVDRIRFTSPHPKDFRREVIDAMAECAAVCEHAHLPLQSGSTRILKAMRRTYSRERFVETRRGDAGGDPGPRTDDGHHRRLSRRDRGRLPRDVAGCRGGRFRRRVHLRLLPARRHGGGGHARPGAGRDQAGAHRAARRRRPDRRRCTKRNACRPRRGGSRRRRKPHRPEPLARPDAAQHDRELLRHRGGGRSRRRDDRACDLDDARRLAARCRRRLRSPRRAVSGSRTRRARSAARG